MLLEYFGSTVLIVVLSCLGLSVLGFTLWVVWDIHKDVVQGRRTIRAMEALIVSEDEKIREIMRD
jgi:hypothetical protein